MTLRRALLGLFICCPVVPWGCDADTVVVSFCTNFSSPPPPPPTSPPVHGCRGGLIVVIHDAPAEDLAFFNLTVRELELLSDGRAFRFFSGRVRRDLLQHQAAGFLLGRRDDVPETEFDTLRLNCSEPEAGFESARTLVLDLANSGWVDVHLVPPLVATSDFTQVVVLDINVDKILSTLDGTSLVSLGSAVSATIRDEANAPIPLASHKGTVLRHSNGDWLFVADGVAGEILLEPTASDEFLTVYATPSFQESTRFRLDGWLTSNGNLVVGTATPALDLDDE